MAQDKRQLQKLLDFIEELSKPENGNDWFVEQLKKKFGGLGCKSVRLEGNEDLEMIKKYLSLDFLNSNLTEDERYAWTRNTLYDFVTDNYIRDNLYLDWNEMLRHRFGTRMHKSSFEECCRYATIQIERVINYYFLHSSNNNHTDAIRKTATVNPLVDINVATIDEVPLANKIYSFKILAQKLKPDYSTEVINHIVYMRNNASHGTTDIIINNEKKIIQNLDEQIKNETDQSILDKLKKKRSLATRFIKFVETNMGNLDIVMKELTNFISITKEMLEKGI